MRKQNRTGLYFVMKFYTLASACSTSASMSSTFSRPTEKRMRPGVTPPARSCSSVSWRWVVLAGYSASVRMSATWVTVEAILSASMKRAAFSRGPLMEKEITPEQPLGRYFFAFSC